MPLGQVRHVPSQDVSSRATGHLPCQHAAAQQEFIGASRLKRTLLWCPLVPATAGRPGAPRRSVPPAEPAPRPTPPGTPRGRRTPRPAPTRPADHHPATKPSTSGPVWLETPAEADLQPRPEAARGRPGPKPRAHWPSSSAMAQQQDRTDDLPLLGRRLEQRTDAQRRDTAARHRRADRHQRQGHAVHPEVLRAQQPGQQHTDDRTGHQLHRLLQRREARAERGRTPDRGAGAPPRCAPIGSYAHAPSLGAADAGRWLVRCQSSCSTSLVGRPATSSGARSRRPEAVPGGGGGTTARPGHEPRTTVGAGASVGRRAPGAPRGPPLPVTGRPDCSSRHQGESLRPREARPGGHARSGRP